MLIRMALESDDEILIRHYRAIWESYGVAAENIKADAEQIVRDFIDDGRSHFKMAAFLAELGGEVVGSAACQLHRVPYPAITIPSFRQHGYIWHVFVEPAVARV